MKREVYYHFYDKWGISNWVPEDEMLMSITYDTQFNVDNGQLTVDGAFEVMEQLTRFQFEFANGVPAIILLAMRFKREAFERCKYEFQTARWLRKRFTSADEYYQALEATIAHSRMSSVEFVKSILNRGA